MKKLLASLLLFITGIMMMISKVDAKDYYSDYTPYSSYTENEVLSSDTVNAETTVFYKWYKEKRENGDYYLYFKNDPNYPNIDVEDYIETEYSNWHEEVPDGGINGRTVEGRTVFVYKDVKPIRYIYLTNLHGSYDALRISEIEILSNGNKIDYEFLCVSCIDTFGSYIKNGVIKENMSSINNNGYLRIDLKDYYNVSDLLIRMSLFDMGDDTKSFTLSITRDESMDNVYFQNTFYYNFKNNSVNEIEFTDYSYSLNSFNVINPEWNEEAKVYYNVYESPIKKVRTYVEYRYKDKKYRYYRLMKVYSDYLNEGNEEYPNRSDEAKTFYRYQTRDKATIADNIVIRKETDSLDDYIVSTTPYQIEGNVLYETNGTYSVKYVLPYKDVLVEVKVDILENTLREYKNEIIELNEVISLKNNELNEINELYQKGLISNGEYQIRVNELEELITDYNNNILELNNKINVQEQSSSDLVAVYEEQIKLYEQELVNRQLENEEISKLIVEYQAQNSSLVDAYNEANDRVNSLNNATTELNAVIDLKSTELTNLYTTSKETLKKCENKLLNQENNIIEKTILHVPDKISPISKIGILSALFCVLLLIYLLIYKYKKSRMK